MKNKIIYLCIAVILFGGLVYAGYYFGIYLPKNNSIERYGILKNHSTSGELRLSYYDMDQKKTLDSWQGYPWFFALPEDLEHNKKLEDFNSYVESNKDSIFKITGTKDLDDCGYYGNGTCLESITIKQIEVVAR